MWNKLTAVGVVGFWLVMMTLLVRPGFLGESAGVNVPPEVVLRKVFSQPAPAQLRVFSDGREIGYCKVDIDPVYEDADDTTDNGSRQPSAYRVQSELTLSLAIFGPRNRVRLIGNSLFNDRFDLEAFRVNALLGEGHVNVRGDTASQKVKIDFFLGEFTDHREMDFAQLGGAGLASAFGLPGLANFSFLGAGGIPTAFQGGPGAPNAGKALTTVRMSHIDIAGQMNEVYLVASRLDETMWTKIWVSRRGEVLKVDTSFRIQMKSEVLMDAQVSPGDPATGEF